MIENIIYFILSAIVLIISATLLIKSLSKIAIFLRISEFTAAFIIMAIASSFPELFVGISSALSGIPELSLGNVIGASILNLTLLMGIFVLLGKGIGFKNKKIGKDIYFVLFGIALMIVLFLHERSLSRIDGVILVLVFAINSFRVLRKREKYTAKYNGTSIGRWEIVYNVGMFIAALVALFFASKYAVNYASLIAIDLQLSQLVVGLFLLSIATVLPELVFGIRAISLGHKEMAIGDQTGTVLANILLVVGIVAIISPIQAALTPFLISSLFLFASALVFVIFLKSKKKLGMLEGVGLILLYVLFTIMEFFVKP